MIQQSLTPFEGAIAERRMAGMLPSHIARAIGTTPGSVRVIIGRLRERGVEFPPIEVRRAEDLSALNERERQIYELTIEGHNTPSIMRELGVQEWLVNALRTSIRAKGVELPTFHLARRPTWPMVKVAGRDARGNYRACISRERDDAIAAFRRAGGTIERVEVLR